MIVVAVGPAMKTGKWAYWQQLCMGEESNDNSAVVT